MTNTDTRPDGIVSLPTEIILAVVLLLEAKDIVRLWRVSKKWNILFRSENLCKPALHTILEEACPNFVADRSAAEQLAYHCRRMKRFYDGEPCGTTSMNLGRGPRYMGYHLRQPDLSYHDGKVAWLDHSHYDENLACMNVRSLLDGHILRKKPSVPRHLRKIILSSCMVAAVADGDRQGHGKSCLAWSLATGEERSFQLLSFAQGHLVSNEWLVTVNMLEGNRDKTLVWNYETNVSYIINLQIPNSMRAWLSTAHLQPDENAIVSYGIGYCDIHCLFGNPQDPCEQHGENETIRDYFCAKFSLVDGTLLSYSKKSICTGPPWELKIIFRITPVNRKGLYTYCVEASESHDSSLRSRTALDKDDCPLLLSLYQYDTQQDQLIIRQHERIVSRSFLKSMQDFDFKCFPWKDTIHMEAEWSSIDVAMRAQLDSKHEERFRFLKHKEVSPNNYAFLLSVDDICTVGYKDEVIVANWYDELAYEKARRVSDDLG